MQKQIPTWLAVVTILVVIAVVAIIFLFASRQQEQKMPEGFKPAPPMSKEAPKAPAEQR